MARILWVILILKVISLASSEETIGEITFDCPEGWKTKFGNCYLFVNAPAGHNLASKVCKGYGSQLAIPKDGSELDYLNEIATSKNVHTFWIGYSLNDSICDGFWDNFQPDRRAGKCVASCGLYMVKPCERTYPYVCQKEACIQGSFQCTNGKCLSSKWICDGENDCGDESDEMNCTQRCTFHQTGTKGNFTANPETCTNNTNCLITLETAIGSKIKLEFTDMNLEMAYDFVEILSGGNSLFESTLIARLTGPTNMTEFFSYNNFFFVRFYTDRKVSKDMFSFNWSTISLQSESLQASSQPQNLVSPQFPNLLPNLQLNWKIVATKGNVITIHLSEFNLPMNKGGSLEIRYGDVLAAKLTKSTENEVFISNTNEVTLYFQTGNAVCKGGFRLTYHEGCNVTLQAVAGVISSPGFNYEDPNSGLYSTKTQCTWSIISPNSQRSVNLIFDEFNLTDSKDFVKVFDGDSELKHLTGTQSVENIKTNQSTMRLKFSSSILDASPGFRATFSMSCPTIEDLVSNWTKLNITSGSENGFQSVLEISCMTGYSFKQEQFNKEDKINMTCNKGGKWSISPYPSCQIVYCGMLPSIENGRIVNASGVTYGGRVFYECTNGFKMTSPYPYTECNEMGKWTALPNCTGFDCPNDREGSNMVIEQESGIDTEYGSIKSTSCEPGYNLVGVSKVFCYSNGTWSSPKPSCQPNNCKIPPDPNANNSWQLVLHGTSSNHSCNDGYIFNGTKTDHLQLLCKLGNLTSNDTLFMEDTKCVDVDECEICPCNKNISSCVNTEGSFECKCHEGYTLIGKTNCTNIDECADGRNGGCDHTCLDTEGSYTCSCKDGYELFTQDGQNQIHLPENDTGTRINDTLRFNHTCIKVLCPNLSPPENGRLMTSKNLFYYNESVSFTCDTGYVMSGQEQLTCQSNRKWDAASPNCTAATCPISGVWDVPEVTVHNDLKTPITFGEAFNLTCNLPNNQSVFHTYFCVYENSTYQLLGDDTPCPEIDCGVPTYDGRPNNLKTNPTTYNSSFVFKCNDRLKIKGNSSSDDKRTVTCQANGLWSYGTLRCEGDMCSDPGSPGDGYQLGTSYLAGGELYFGCNKSGFSPSPSYPISCNGTHWNASVPECKDSEKPTFTSCPKESFTFEYLKPIVIPDLGVQDNVGIKSITPRPLKINGSAMPNENQTLSFIAKDYEGNAAKCKVDINVRKEQPLNLTCPPEVIVNVTSKDTSLDLSQFVQKISNREMLQLFPSTVNVTSEMAGKYLQVFTNLTEDDISCYFLVRFEATTCFKSTLRDAANSKKTCTADSGDMSCTITCDSGYVFSDNNQTWTADCSGNDVWIPSRNSGDCIVERVAFYFSSPHFEYIINDESVTGFDISKEETNFKSKLEALCSNVIFNFNSNHFNQSGDRVNVYYNFNITSTDPSLKKNLKSCEKAISNYNVSDLKLITPGYLDAIPITLKVVITVQCPPNSITINTSDRNTYCNECPSGTYSDQNDCVPCPVGKYRPITVAGSCLECPKETTTYSNGSSSIKDCIEYCPPGFNSSNGLPPCQPCPVDTYSVSNTQCKACENNSTTLGREASEKCFGLCPQGSYSSTGYEPCTECPLNFYQSSNGSTECLECDNKRFTTSTGASKCFDCTTTTCRSCKSNEKHLVVDHQVLCYCVSQCNDIFDACNSNPCYHNGTCNSTGNDYTCTCLQSANCSFTSVGSRDVFKNQNPLKHLTEQQCQEKCLEDVSCKVYAYFTTFKKCYIGTALKAGFKTGFKTYRKDCTYTTLYNGSRCENKVSPYCTESICGTNGECQEKPDGYNCLCQPGYYGKPCIARDNPCENITCSGHGKPLSFGIRCDCECEWGSTGKNCEKSMNDCDGNPCLFGGKCIDGNNTFTCECIDGYTGSQCEKPPNYCQDTPCSNTSTTFCHNDYDTSNYTCYCDPPYKLNSSGVCELVDYCEEQPCANNGNCTNLPLGGFNCSCPVGFTGSKCQHNINDCYPDPCMNGASCIDLVDGYKCQCLPHFTGVNCSIQEDSCFENGSLRSCSQNTTLNCTNLPGDEYKCHCKEGYEGKNCEMDIDECVFEPCEHGGSCSNTNGSFDCTCKDGWIGRTCERTEDFCRTNSCQNAAPCFSSPYDFYCRCKDGFKGENCSIPANDKCNFTNVCMNDGSCENSTDCSCPSNYTGMSCELNKDLCQQKPCGDKEICENTNYGYSCLKKNDDSSCVEKSKRCQTIPCPSMNNPLEESGNSKNFTDDFDIYFDRNVSPDGATLSRYVQFATNAFSMSLKVLYADRKNSNGALFTLRKENKNGDLEDYLLISNEGISLNSTFEEYNFNLNSQKWCSLFISIDSTGEIKGLIDDIKIIDVNNLPALELNNATFSIIIGRDFHGYISQLKIYNKVVAFETQPSAAFIKWGGYIPSTRARIQIPSRVGSKICESCKSDKVSPVFSNCNTTDIYLRCPNGSCALNITQPSANGGDLLKTIKAQDDGYTRGSTKEVIFVAKDNFGNTASCRSKLYVPYKDCEYPVGFKPTTCRLGCPLGQALCMPYPREMSCSKLGVFNRKNPLDSVLIPPCGVEEDVLAELKLTFGYKLNIECSNSKELVTTHTKEITESFANKYWGLVNNNDFSNVEYNYTCGADKVITMAVIIPYTKVTITKISDNSTINGAMEMEKLLKEDQIYKKLTENVYGSLVPDKAKVVSLPQCKPGFGLFNNKCVQCGPGTYYDESTVSCKYCPIGSFQNQSGQASCYQCPNNQSTENIGKANATSCYENCPAGQFFDSGNCQPCEKGFYQAETGKKNCLPCPLGKSTYAVGANSSDLCLNDCSRGKYLNGTVCTECPIGKYQDNELQDHCIPCPTNTTTRNAASTDNSTCEEYCSSGSERENKTTPCTPCQEGYFRLLNMSNPFDRCIKCPEDFTTNGEGDTSCPLRICPSGQFRDTVNNTCNDCPLGYYQPNKTTDKCLKCEFNHTTLKVGSKNESDCILFCTLPGYEIGPDGKFCHPCAKGTYKNSTSGGQEKCSPCPQNFTTSINEGAINITQCDLRDCPVGTFINETSCILCPNATYQSEKSKYSCEQCGDSTYTFREGATDKNECQIICAAGLEGQKNCSACKDGYFKNITAAVPCEKCPTHFTSDPTRTDCILHCPEGYSNTSETSCEPCAKGKFKSQPGNTECESCPNTDYTTSATESTSSDNCSVVNCQPGNTFNTGTKACQACSKGTYQDQIGDHPCKSCPATFITATTGANNISDCSILHCPEGYSNTSETSCEPCAKGKFKSQPGNTECENCPNTAYTTSATGSTSSDNCSVVNCQPGNTFNTGTKACQACSKGTYQDQIGDHPCKSCPATFITATTGANNISDCSILHCPEGYSNTSETSCEPCAKGKFKSQPGNTECESCPNTAYTTSATGSTSSDNCSVVNCPPGSGFNMLKNICINCTIGEYQPNTGNVTCLPCKANFTTSKNASTEESDCIIPVCTVGEEPGADYKSCKECDIGYYKSDTSTEFCVKCSANKTTKIKGASRVADCVEETKDPSVNFKTTVDIDMTLEYKFTDCENNKKSNAEAVKTMVKNRLKSMATDYKICEGECKVKIEIKCSTSRRNKRDATNDKANIKVGNVKKDTPTKPENLFRKDCKENKNGYKLPSATMANCLVKTSCSYSILVSGKCQKCSAGTRAIETGCEDCPGGTYSAGDTRNCTDCPYPLGSVPKATNESLCLPKCLVSSTYCQNGGICMKGPNDLYNFCSCPDKYKGEACEIYTEPANVRLQWIAVVIGCSAGILALILLIVGVVTCLRTKRKKQKEKHYLEMEQEECNNYNYPYTFPLPASRSTSPFGTVWDDNTKF